MQPTLTEAISPQLAAIAATVAAGGRISDDDALALLACDDLPFLGQLAEQRRYQRVPDRRVTFIVDRNVNYTNVCITRCKFCAFYRLPGDAEGYVLSHEEIFAKIDELRAQGGHQLLLQGGHHPDLHIEWFEALFRAIKGRYPDLRLHALSASEIQHIARRSHLDLAETIRRLHAAGLDSIPGAGAEILDDRVRSIIAPYKESTEGWLAVMREAHRQGLRTSATMMFGTVESDAEIVHHLRAIRDLQDESGGFIAFIPWSFQPEHTELPEATRTSATDYLRILAVSRIYLDNVDHLQASWVTQGEKIGQLALFYGADDMGSTMLEENVVSAAGCTFRLGRQELGRLIEAAGFEPALRDQEYRVVGTP